MSKKIIIIGCFIITFLVAVIVGFLVEKTYTNNSISNISKGNNFKNEQIEKRTVETSEKEKEKISPNAKLVKCKLYKRCGHIIEQTENVPEKIVNMNEDYVKRYYSDWKIEKFSNKEVKLFKEVDERCNKHYVVKEDEGRVTVYNEEDDGRLEAINKTEIQTKYLGDDDRLKLKDGVKIVGDKNLSLFLEDFE